MKFGRVAGHELETLCAALKKILSRKATHSAAFILAPYLVSDRVLHGIRGEVRLEDKLDAKGVMSYADWKKGSAIFSGHRAYDPEVSVSQNLNVTDYPMKFVSVSVDSSQRGVKQFKFNLPNNVRLMYHQDPLRAGEWKNLISDFDSKLPIFAISTHCQVLGFIPERTPLVLFKVINQPLMH
ncbi:unnamed protein product [Durusdinium trenchii]|uniref:Uncharacterized protein n=1 Tax=Durusdinium trenchii TaxID=1381693 RepID=A0ABP0NMB3_9DINO